MPSFATLITRGALTRTPAFTTPVTFSTTVAGGPVVARRTTRSRARRSLTRNDVLASVVAEVEGIHAVLRRRRILQNGVDLLSCHSLTLLALNFVRHA